VDQALSSVKEKYDYILLDTSPITLVPEVMVFANYVQGILYVCRSNQSNKFNVLRDIKKIKATNPDYLYMILNFSQESIKPAYYYRYYYKT